MRGTRAYFLVVPASVLVVGLLVWQGAGKDQAPPGTPSTYGTQSPTGAVLGIEGLRSEEPVGDQLVGEPAPATKERTAHTTHQPETHLVREALQTKGLLHGRVMLAGTPLQGVRVEAWRDLLLPSIERLGEATSDADGRFSVRGLGQGIYGLLFEGHNVPRGFQVVGIHLDDDETRDIGYVDVPSPVSLTGKLVDREGQPLAGILVMDSPGKLPRFDQRAADLGISIFETATDARGYFAFENALPGLHTILAGSGQFTDKRLSSEVDAGARHDFGPVVLERGTPLRGRVVTSDGHPIQGASVIPFNGPRGMGERRTIRTSADGGFELYGTDSFFVQADGFEEAVEQATPGDEPVLIQLRPTVALTGRVEGAGGRRTYVVVKNHGAGKRRSPPSTRALLENPIPVETDGSFRIEGFAEGQGFTILAEAEGLGASEPVSTALWPGSEPIVLRIVPRARLRVVVRDDLGRPVQGAEAYTVDPQRLLGAGRREMSEEERHSLILLLLRREQSGQPTDEEGRVELLQDRGKPVALAITHPDHLPRPVWFRANPPNPIEVVLQRAARLSGRLTDVTGRREFSLSVQVTPVDPATGQVTKGGRTLSVDEGGSFHAEQMVPGTYEVAVQRRNVKPTTATGGPRPRTIPLLGVGLDNLSIQSVELRAGESTDVVLQAAPLGSVYGRVFYRDSPMSGVKVFATSPSREDASTNPEAARLFTVTERDGSFLFLYPAPGIWALRAHHPKAPAPTSEIVVRATGYGLDIQQDLHLDTGSVQGHVDMETLSEAQRRRLVAYLFPIEGSAHDPFSGGRNAVFQASQMRKVEIGPDGQFEFPFVPEREWILRLVSRPGEIILQRQIRTQPFLVTDTGRLRAPTTISATVEIELPHVVTDPGNPIPGFSYWVRIREPLPGLERGMFAGNAGITRGQLQVEGLAPGTYELELFRVPNNSPIGAHSSRFSGESTALFRTLVVRPDGTTEPAQLSFR